MNPVFDSGGPLDELALRSILANLSGEIRRPLSLLHGKIGAILSEPEVNLSETERSQAATMLSLCDEIDRLTRDYLGASG